MTPDRPTPACACQGRLDGAQVTHTRDACTETSEGLCPVTGFPERSSYTVLRTSPPKPPKAKPRERTRDRLRRMSQRRPKGR